MPRYKLTIEYDGTPYVGWQAQDNGVSVQGVLTAAIAAFAGEQAAVGAAGRTDAGVHALGQVAHVDLGKDWDAETVRDAINFHLRPQPIAVLAVERAALDFDGELVAGQFNLNRHPEVAAKRPSKDAARALRPSLFEVRFARTSG